MSPRNCQFPHVVDLGITLQAGQVFSWQLLEESSEWVGVLENTVFWLKQTDNGAISFRYDGDIKSDMTALHALERFFQVHIPLQDHLIKWGDSCEAFEKCIIGSKFASGLRICYQNPFECLISFIVSANNHIKRISKNVLSIRSKYGVRVDSKSDICLYNFPTPKELSKATVEELRELGLGYRAQYIVTTVKMIHTQDLHAELLSLRSENDIVIARQFLMQFQGVGRKVADCVALYSLNYHQLAPVDTHMLKIAIRIFKNAKLNKDKDMHDKIQQLMIDRYGALAGIAHCYLFAADLRTWAEPPQGKRSRIDVHD